MAVKRHKPTVSLTLPLELDQWLHQEAVDRGVTKSQVVAEALQLLQVGMVYQLDKSRITVSPGIIQKSAA